MRLFVIQTSFTLPMMAFEKREKTSECMIQKILTIADNEKSEIKNKPSKSILLSLRHHDKNQSVGFVTIVELGTFCSNNEPNWPMRSQIKSMCMTNKTTSIMKNLNFNNLQ